MNKDKNLVLNKIKTIAKLYDVNIIKDGLLLKKVPHPCPFDANIGLLDKKNIIMVEDPSIDTVCVSIHELGHCVFDKSKNFSKANEFQWLIWEYCVAVDCSIVKEWDSANYNYDVSPLGDWGSLSNSLKESVLSESWKTYKDSINDLKDPIMKDIIKVKNNIKYFVENVCENSSFYI